MGDTSDGKDSWGRYEKLVLHELKRLNTNIEDVANVQKRIDKELEVVKTKAAFLGSMGGLVIVFFDSLVEYLRKL